MRATGGQPGVQQMCERVVVRVRFPGARLTLNFPASSAELYLVRLAPLYLHRFPARRSLIALMMEAVQTSETQINSYQSTRRYNPEDSHLHGYNLDSTVSGPHMITRFHFFNKKFPSAIRLQANYKALRTNFCKKKPIKHSIMKEKVKPYKFLDCEALNSL
jgi:hypothetical protein